MTICRLALIPLLLVLGACGDSSPGVDAGLKDASELRDGSADVSADVADLGSQDMSAPKDLRGDGAVADALVPTPLRVLFVGNSYTGVNGLPAALASLSQDPASSIRVTVGQHTPGGARWEEHDQNAAVTQLIQQGWDYVVFQDQSQQPWAVSSIKPALRSLAAKVAAAGAKTMLFMTWARSAAVAGTHHEHFRMRMAVSRYYEAHGEAVGAQVVPVGRAWERALRTSGVTLHSGDGSHPNVQGTYLAACSFYVALSGKSPVGLGLGGLSLSKTDAAFLQQVAWDTSLARSAPTAPLLGAWPLSAKPTPPSDLQPGAKLVLGGLPVGAAKTATQFGGGAYAAVPYRPRFRPKKGLTVAVSVHRADWSAPRSEGIVGKFYGFQLLQEQTQLKARIHTEVEKAPATLSADVGSLAAGWHHVALTYDGTTYALWVDAVEVASATTNGALRYYLNTPTESLVYAGIAVGGVPHGPIPSVGQAVYLFTGALSDLRLYERALTQSELQALLP